MKNRYSVLVPVLTKIFAVLTSTNEVLSNGTVGISFFNSARATISPARIFCFVWYWVFDAVLTKILMVLTGTNEVLSIDIFYF